MSEFGELEHILLTNLFRQFVDKPLSCYLGWESFMVPWSSTDSSIKYKLSDLRKKYVYIYSRYFGKQSIILLNNPEGI